MVPCTSDGESAGPRYCVCGAMESPWWSVLNVDIYNVPDRRKELLRRLFLYAIGVGVTLTTLVGLSVWPPEGRSCVC